MKSINKKNIDAMAEARKYKKFQEAADGLGLKLRLAVEIYKERGKLNLSQQDLAKKIYSTQKVISKLENGEVNVGLDLLSRLAAALSFTIENWSRIYDFTVPAIKVVFAASTSNHGSNGLSTNKLTNINKSNFISLIK